MSFIARLAQAATALTMMLAPDWAAAQTAAQTFPDHLLTIVVPQPPGGGFDLVGRVVADRLGAQLGQSVVVENKPGSGTLVGSNAVAKAAPDGYTLLVGGLPNIVLNVGLYPKLPYDPLKDLTPVGLVVSYTYALVTRKDLALHTLQELIAFARANPDKLLYASGGRGTGQHIAAAVMAQLAGVKMTHVPYRGAQSAYQDVLGGRIDMFFDNISTALPLIDAGQVDVLAVSATKRHPRLPDVPTVMETGVAPLDLDTWFGIFAPSATPAPVLEKLREAMAKVAADPTSQATFVKGGGIPLQMTMPQTEALVVGDMARWTRLIKDADITVE